LLFQINISGFPQIGTLIEENDVIVGKKYVIPTSINVKSKYTHRDHSLISRAGESGIVDQVLVSRNNDGYKV
jgi:DNA-directed RNA polymerase beta subunit